MQELIHGMLAKMLGFDRATRPLGVGGSKDMGVLPVVGVTRVQEMLCETRVCIVSPDRAVVYFEPYSENSEMPCM